MSKIWEELQRIRAQRKSCNKMRSVLNYAFPKTDGTIDIEAPNKWYRRIALFNTAIALICVSWLVKWLIYAIQHYDYHIWFPFGVLFGIAPTLVAVGNFAVLCSIALVLQRKKRSPWLVLALTPVKPIKCFFFALLFFRLILLAGMKDDFIDKTYLTQKVREAYYKKNRDPYIQKTFLGFSLGKDTYYDVVDRLKAANLSYSQNSFKDSGYLVELHVKKYPMIPSETKVSEEYFEMDLKFDQNHVLYSLDAGYIPLEITENLLEIFKKQYENWMRDAWLFYSDHHLERGRTTYFYTPGDIEIRLQTGSVAWHYLPSEKPVEITKERLTREIALKDIAKIE